MHNSRKFECESIKTLSADGVFQRHSLLESASGAVAQTSSSIINVKSMKQCASSIS